jgi:hypothetical protein
MYKESTLGKMQKPPVLGERLNFSQEIATAEVKTWVTKIQFQRVRLTREQMHHLPFHWRSLWL